jgi:twitching motility protein PilT
MRTDINNILKNAVELQASDVLLIPGLPITLKMNGSIHRMDGDRLQPDDIFSLIKEMLTLLKGKAIQNVMGDCEEDDDFSFAIPGLARFRGNVFKQRGSLAAVIRVVSFELPNWRKLNIPESVINMAQYHRGLVLVTGPAGSGKSTTLACLVDTINSHKNVHIITIEDPIEYLHQHKMGVVTQREIETDTVSYASALRSALRQAPDVILLGEMRDYETIKAAVTAAETGHLVISSLHTTGAVNTVDRIIDSFPPAQQHQIRIQLAMVLMGIVSQQLVTTVQGAYAPAFEIVVCNNAIRNMIRESSVHQMESLIYSSSSEGMVTMDAYLLNMVKKGLISPETALQAAMNKEQMQKRLTN